VFGLSIDQSAASASQLLRVVAKLSESDLSRLHMYVTFVEHLDSALLESTLRNEYPGRRGQVYWLRDGTLIAYVATCTEDNRSHIKRLTEDVLA
jgi:hypothetical protein